MKGSDQFMKDSTRKIIAELGARYPKLRGSESSLLCGVDTIAASYAQGGKLLICGNGGSAADAMHTVGELMKAFVLPRKINGEMRERLIAECEHGGYIADNLQGALPAISLVNEVALQTAYANDAAASLVFAQQVFGYGCAGDVLLAISTSGKSENVIYACEVAHVKGMKVVGLTGEMGGEMRSFCDVTINVPERETYKIQEYHLPVYHSICLALENEFFGEA